MNITHPPILYQAGGMALLDHSHMPDNTATLRWPGTHSRESASNVPLEYGIEGELLKARAQAHPRGDNGRSLGEIYHGESWTAGGSSTQRAISIYQFHAQIHQHPARHLIDTYA